MTTMATYDVAKNIVIPQNKPAFNRFKQVLVVFVPQETAVKTSRNTVRQLLEKNWQYNQKALAEKLNDAVSESIAVVRDRPKEDLILD